MKKTLLYISLFFIGISLFGFKKPDAIKTMNPPNPPKPNVIVIMCDDLGYADVGFNGSTEIPTPNIDRIANEGIKFTNGHVTYSVCGPSRAGFITGRYSQRFGHERNPVYKPTGANRPGLPLDENTIAETLPANYNTGIIGKWHLGAQLDNHPLNRGFDEFYGHIGGGHRYLPDETDNGNSVWSHSDSYSINTENDSYKTWIMDNFNHINPNTMGSGTYLTDFFSDEAVSFIQTHAADTDPFFLFLSYNAPHGPLQATQEYLNRFSSLSGNRKTYAAMISAVDDGVGDILAELADSGIDDDTVIFFLSDNGGKESHGADNSPLRGFKGATYEGGWRVPFAMRYPAVITTPSVYNKPVSSLDIFATTIELAEATQPANKPLDGVNLIPYVTGVNTQDPHPILYLRKFDGQNYAVIKDGFKLYSQLHNGIHKLYNLNNDIGETTNIYDDNLDIVDELTCEREQWTAQLIDPIFEGITTANLKVNASASPSDHLVNHNFELGDLTGWGSWNNEVTNEASNVNSGAWAGKLDRGSSNGAGMSQIIELKANTQYQIKFWAKSESPGTYNVTVKDNITNEKFLVDDFDTTNTYQQFVKTVNIGNTENIIKISIWWQNTPSNTPIYIDDVEVIEVGSSDDQLRLKTEGLEAMETGITYQARAIEIPLTAWLGPKTWEIINGTGSATIDSKGLITPTSGGTITLKVSTDTSSNTCTGISSKASAGASSKVSAATGIIFHEKELTIQSTLGVDSNIEDENSLFSINGSNIVEDEISLKSNHYLNDVSVSIFSLSGKLLFNKKYINLPENIYNYKLSNLQSGLYFIKINTPDKHQILKFIKK